jgi:anti-sigma regulatory factor (Ser/Thr protein kinase)
MASVGVGRCRAGRTRIVIPGHRAATEVLRAGAGLPDVGGAPGQGGAEVVRAGAGGDGRRSTLEGAVEGLSARRSIERLELAHEAPAATTARHWSLQCLGGWSAVRHDDVQLVVSELVTNATLHGAPPVAVELAWDAERIRIAVSDGDLGAVAVTPPPHRGIHGGRGLAIVERLAERWGVERIPGGKMVWAELGPTATDW